MEIVRSGRHDGHGLEERSTADLARELLEQSKVVFGEQVKLARAEAHDAAAKVKQGGVMLGLGGAYLHAALLGIGATVAFLLALWMPLWVAALIVTVGYAVIGGIMVAVGRARVRRVGMRRTIKSLEEDRQWASRTWQSVQSNRHESA